MVLPQPVFAVLVVVLLAWWCLLVVVGRFVGEVRCGWRNSHFRSVRPIPARLFLVTGFFSFSFFLAAWRTKRSGLQLLTPDEVALCFGCVHCVC